MYDRREIRRYSKNTNFIKGHKEDEVMERLHRPRLKGTQNITNKKNQHRKFEDSTKLSCSRLGKKHVDSMHVYLHTLK